VDGYRLGGIVGEPKPPVELDGPASLALEIRRGRWQWQTAPGHTGTFRWWPGLIATFADFLERRLR